MEEVGNAATRLESSFESRRATIRNLAVLRSIEDQAHEVSDNFNQFSSRKDSDFEDRKVFCQPFSLSRCTWDLRNFRIIIKSIK